MMNLKFAIPVIAACAMISGVSLAQTQSSAGTYGAGTAEADRDGAYADGTTAGKAKSRAEDRRDRRAHRDRKRVEAASPNSASTYGSGAVYTSRRNSSAAVTTGGSASGTGSQAAGSTVDVYGETTRDGSSADVYGDSTATSEPRSPKL